MNKLKQVREILEKIYKHPGEHSFHDAREAIALLDEVSEAEIDAFIMQLNKSIGLTEEQAQYLRDMIVTWELSRTSKPVSGTLDEFVSEFENGVGIRDGVAKILQAAGVPYVKD